jgi:hypothetical protein
MKHGDVGTIEVVLDTDESVISNALCCGKNEFPLRIATPECPDVCVHGSDVYICVKNPTVPSFKKPF